jgi:hypothetical protein
MTAVDDKRLTGHQNTSTADENTVCANAILKGKCYVKLIDIDRQMDVSVCAASNTDRGQLNHTSFSVELLSKSHSTLTVTLPVMHLKWYANQGQQI